MALQLPHLGPRARKIARYAGFVVLALVTFVFAIQMTFPFHRVKGKLIELLAEKYEVTIGDVERGLLPGRMSIKALTLRTRPAKADDVPTTFYIERLDVGVGLFALLRGTASIDLDAKIGPGHIAGTVALSKAGTEIDVEGDDLPSASLPMSEIIGLPMSGKIGFSVALELPNEKSKTGKVGANWAKAEGAVTLVCPSGCTVGDGKAKLKPKLKNRGQQAFAEGGIDFGKVTIDTLAANVTIKNGKLTVSRFDAKSADGELNVDLDISLAQDINASVVTGCLRFKGSEGLLKREPKTHAAISTTGAPLGPDNLFHIRLDGALREVRRLGQVCTGGGSPNMDNPAGAPARPNLTITPETPAPAAPPPSVGRVPGADELPPPPIVPPGTPGGPNAPAVPDATNTLPTPLAGSDADVQGPGVTGTGTVVPAMPAPGMPNGAVPVQPQPGAPGAAPGVVNGGSVVPSVPVPPQQPPPAYAPPSQ